MPNAGLNICTHNQVGPRDAVVRVEDEQLGGQPQAAGLAQLRGEQQTGSGQNLQVRLTH